VSVEEAVLVAIDADADAVARRNAGVGLLLAGGRGEIADLGIGPERLARLVGAELARGQTHGATLLPRARTLDHDVALARRRPRPGRRRRSGLGGSSVGRRLEPGSSRRRA